MQKVQAVRDGPILAARKASELEKAIREEEVLSTALALKLRALWDYDDEERAVRDKYLKRNPLVALYLRLADWCWDACSHNSFVNFITFFICVAGLTVGVETDLAQPGIEQAFF